jgi:integrase
MLNNSVIYRKNDRRYLEKLLKRIENSDICEENKKSILDFLFLAQASGFSIFRLLKYATILFYLAKMLDKPFLEATKEDIIRIVQKIESRDCSDWTKRDYKLVLKKFYKWLKRTDYYPDEVVWIRTSVRNRFKLPEELLSEDDIKRLVDAAENLRDKALILVLYESGCRIGELLTLRLKHVVFDEYGAVLMVSGKTGQRGVRIVFSAPKLQQWVENHPLKDDPDAPLWVTRGTSKRNTILTYGSVSTLLRMLAKRAGIKKRVYPHLFRHSRATHLANHLTEAQMKQYFGWVQGSRMASIYVHLSGRDVDRALLRLNGINLGEEVREEIKSLVCPRCRARNSPDARFCSKCGLCLDPKTAMQVDELKAKIDRLINELIKNPKYLESLLENYSN